MGRPKRERVEGDCVVVKPVVVLLATAEIECRIDRQSQWRDLVAERHLHEGGGIRPRRIVGSPDCGNSCEHGDERARDRYPNGAFAAISPHDW
jgi:hypothetical protein